MPNRFWEQDTLRCNFFNIVKADKILKTTTCTRELVRNYYLLNIFFVYKYEQLFWKKEIFVSQFQLDQSLEIRCQSYIHTKNEKTNKEFIVWQSAALSTTNILLLVTHILSESNDSTLFIIIINISIITIIMIIMKRKFYFILDEFGCHIYFNTFQLIVLCYFLQQLI